MRASARPARAIMCDSWPAMGSRATSSPSRRVRARMNWSRSAFRHTGASRSPRRKAGSGSGSPRSDVHGRADEELEGDEHRDRVPREVEDEVVAANAKGDRLPRLHGDSPEDFLDTKPRLRLTHQVVRPDGGASGGHEHVEAEQGALHGALELVRVVPDHPELGRYRARQLQRGREQKPVRLVDLPGTELLPRLLQLGPRDQDPDARALGALHLVDACRRERADLRGPKANSRIEYDIAGPHVASTLPDIGAGGDRFPDLDRLARVLHQLERDDRIGPLGNRAAGGDRHRLAGRERPLGGRPGGDPGDDREAGAHAGVLCPDREAVHRGAREGRQIDQRGGRLREDPAGRALNRDALCVEALRALENEPLCLRDRDQLRRRAHGRKAIGAPRSRAGRRRARERRGARPGPPPRRRAAPPTRRTRR